MVTMFSPYDFGSFLAPKGSVGFRKPWNHLYVICYKL